MNVSAKFCQPMTENDSAIHVERSAAIPKIGHVKTYKKLLGYFCTYRKIPGDFCTYNKIPVRFRRTEKSLYACKDDQNGCSGGFLAHGIWSWNGSSTGAVARLPTNFDDEHSTVGVCGAGVCGFAVSAAAGSNGLT